MAHVRRHKGLQPVMLCLRHAVLLARLFWREIIVICKVVIRFDNNINETWIFRSEPMQVVPDTLPCFTISLQRGVFCLASFQC